jgi:hypothetical protein
MSDEKELTPQEQLALEQAKAATAKEARERAEAEERSKVLDAKNRDLRVADTIKAAIAATKITFHPTSDELFKLVSTEPGVKIVPSADGDVLHCEKDGKEISFTALVEDFTLRNQYVADGRTLRHLKTDEKKITCLDELVDRADRIAFISANGEDAFARLPQHRPVKVADPAKMTAQQWKDLPIVERARLCNELTEEQRARILQRKESKQ